jgi:tetratricopeptide (TPR) repeat protein
MAYRMTRAAVTRKPHAGAREIMTGPPARKDHAMTDLPEAIRQGWADARRDDPERTVGYFRDLLGQHPADARALFEYAGALDFADREAEAAPVYEQAFSAGLDGDDLRRGLIQYGSTLRNLGRFDEAVSVLRRADEQFPGHDSVAAFLALALTSAGRCHEAVARLLNLALDRVGGEDLGQYQWALRQYAADLSE